MIQTKLRKIHLPKYLVIRYSVGWEVGKGMWEEEIRWVVRFRVEIRYDLDRWWWCMDKVGIQALGCSIVEHEKEGGGPGFYELIF